MTFSSIYPKSFFPGAGREAALSAIHAQLFEGDLVKANAIYQYSYNGFNAPLLTFHRDGVVLHESICNAISEYLDYFIKCDISEVIYFPYWKTVEIQFSPDFEEILMEKGIWKLLTDYSAPSLPRAGYYVSPGINGDERDKKLANKYLIEFDSECFVCSETIYLDATATSSFLFSKGAIWFCSADILKLLRPYLDEDYYRVNDHYIDS